MPSAGELYLRIRRNESASTVTIHFPIVTRIEDTIRANLTEISTIVYGSANRFVMDLGTQRSFTISAIRINPDSWNDSSDDSDRWSNGEFENRLVDALDFWQNFGYTQDGVWAGGFELEFVSADEDAYPSFRENVFLTGSFTPSYTRPGQRVLYQMTFAVASMQGYNSTVSSVTIYMHTTVEGVEYTETKVVPRGYTTSIPSYPSGWLSLYKGYSLKGWSLTDGGSVDYRPGDTYGPIEEDLHLYAVWARPVCVMVFDETTYATLVSSGGTYSYRDVPESVTVPTQYASIATCTAICIGGGGAAGKANWYRLSDGGIDSDYNVVYVPGGAGGAGQYVMTSFTVYPGQAMTVTVGKGGIYRDYDPVDATLSAVTLDGVTMATANAGFTGGDSTGSNSYFSMQVGAGGAQYYAGGRSYPYMYDEGEHVGGLLMSESYSTDGSSDGAGVPGAGIQGGYSFGSSVFRYIAIPGGGGGAAPLDDHFEDQSGNRYPETGSYTSKGGDGFIDANTFSEEDNFGRYGGGGGAGFRFWDMDGYQFTWFDRYSQGGDGGDGIVILLFFEE